MSFCSKCGTQIESADQQFCTNCGAKVEKQVETSTSVVNSALVYEQQPVQNQYTVPTPNPIAQHPMKWFKLQLNSTSAIPF